MSSTSSSCVSATSVAVACARRPCAAASPRRRTNLAVRPSTTPGSGAPTRAGARCTRAGCCASSRSRSSPSSSARSVVLPVSHRLDRRLRQRRRHRHTTGRSAIGSIDHVRSGRRTATACACVPRSCRPGPAPRDRRPPRLRASKRSSPRYFGRHRRSTSRHPAFEMLISTIIGRSWRLPTSKSLKSCAGVIFTAPEPNSGSAILVATIGICAARPAAACTFLPIRSLVALVAPGAPPPPCRPASSRAAWSRHDRSRTCRSMPVRRPADSAKCQMAALDLALSRPRGREIAVSNCGSQLTRRLSLVDQPFLVELDEHLQHGLRQARRPCVKRSRAQSQRAPRRLAAG